MIHTPLPSRCNAVTVAGPPVAPAPLRGRSSDRCGHRSVGGRRLITQGCRCRSRSRNRTADPVSRRHGSASPGLPPVRSSSIRSSVLPARCLGGVSTGVPLSAFLHLRTGELVHPVGVSTACPGTGTGHGTASSACRPTLHQRDWNSQFHEPGESPQRGWLAAVVQLAFHAPAPTLSEASSEAHLVVRGTPTHGCHEKK